MPRLPDDDRGRPAARAAHMSPSTKIAAPDTIPEQLRRRRAASYRLPALEDGTGRRDSLDPATPASRHNSDSGVLTPKPRRDCDVHCCLSLSCSERETAARRGYYCGPDKCAKSQLLGGES